jgi:spermidine synthase
MPLPFEILDSQPTPLGELMLRRRRIVSLDDLEVLEVKLGDEFLMSSLFHVVEEALADLGLAETEGDELDVVVGGLGLGYTAAASLRETRVRELLVVDRMPSVIGWHRDGLVPLGRELAADGRCRLVEGDFFVLAADPAGGFDPAEAGRRFDAVLLDIDHSPRKLLHGSHGAFYSQEGLTRLAEHLHPGGVFALWSDDPPDEPFLADLHAVFAEVSAEIVAFPNPLLDRDSESTVYVAKTRR